MLFSPTAILFDWDNTLVDTWDVIHFALNATFTDMGYTPWTMEETQIRVHRSARERFPEIFGEKSEEALALYYRHFLAAHLEKLRPLPGSYETLSWLKTTDLHVAIVSNKKGDIVRQEITHLEWDAFFKKTVGSLDATHDKPHSASLLKALENTSITPGKNVWFVGDSKSDMECAYYTGCTPILFGPHDAIHLNIDPCWPAYHVRTQHELLVLLQKYFSSTISSYYA